MRFAIFLVAIVAILSDVCLAAPLETIQSFAADHGDKLKRGQLAMPIVRGEGTDDFYVLEVDPATGQLPVSASVSVDIDYSGATGAGVPAEAAYIGGIDINGDLQGVFVDGDGHLQVDVLSSALPTGAATSANQTTANTSLSTIAGAVSGTEMQVDVVSSALPTGAATAANQTTANTSLSTIAGAVSGTEMQVDVVSSALPTGAATAANQATANTSLDDIVTNTSDVATETTLSALNDKVANGTGTAAGAVRVVTASDSPQQIGRAYADSVRNDYSSDNVTTGAWVELIASTAAAINCLTVFDSSGQTLELGTGAAAAETRVLIVPPGGHDGCIPLRIASGTRLSIRAISATASVGEINITGLN